MTLAELSKTVRRPSDPDRHLEESRDRQYGDSVYAPGINDHADAPSELPKHRPSLMLDFFIVNGTTSVKLACGTSHPTMKTAAMKSR